MFNKKRDEILEKIAQTSKKTQEKLKISLAKGEKSLKETVDKMVKDVKTTKELVTDEEFLKHLALLLVL